MSMFNLQQPTTPGQPQTNLQPNVGPNAQQLLPNGMAYDPHTGTTYQNNMVSPGFGTTRLPNGRYFNENGSVNPQTGQPQVPQQPSNPQQFNPMDSSHIGNYMSAYNQAMNPSSYSSAQSVQSPQQVSNPAYSQGSPYMTSGGAQQGTNQYLNTPGYELSFGQTGQNIINNSGAMQYLNQQTNPIQSMFQGYGDLQNFFNSGAYKLQYGNNQALDPAQRFENDPGIQKAIQAGLPALANSYSAKGLGASGVAAQGLMDNMYKNYNDYMNQQQNLYQLGNSTNFNQNLARANMYQGQQNALSSLFGNYQNMLSGVSGAGDQASNTAGAGAYGSSQNLASLLAGLFSGTGSALAGNQMNTGNNISELLANLGYFGGNAYLNTGAAQSNNMLQGSLFGAQLANQQNASNAGTLNSLLGGIGAMNGVNQLYGAGSSSGGYGTYGAVSPGGFQSYYGNPMGPFGGSM